MYPPQIVIHIQGGIVQEIYSSDREADIVLVNWDVPKTTHREPSLVAITLRGRRVRSHVSAVSPRPLHELAGSDLEQAVEAAFQQGVLAEVPG